MTEHDTGRRSGGRLALLAAGQVFVVLVGAGILVAAVRDGSTYGVLFGVLLTGLGVVSLAATVLETSRRGSTGAVVGRSPAGVPATVLPRAGWVPAVTAGFLVVLAGCALAAGVVAVGRDDLVVAVVLLAVGAVLATYLAFVARGRMPAGGVYLAADGVTNVKDGATWRIGWDDIAGVVPGEPLAVVLRDGARPVRSSTAPPGWRGEVRAPEGTLAVQTRYLSDDAATLAFVLLAYRDRPDLRPQLGTQASLDWEILRQGS